MGYPWQIGDALLATDLNAAITNAGVASGTFNVRDHGVKMDGVTDDYAALTAANAAAAAVSGSVLYFPPSPTPLLLSQPIAIGSDQTWWAYPGTVTIRPTASNVSSVILWGSNNTSNVRLHGLTFDGGGQDFANAGAICQPYRVTGLTLDRVRFQNIRGQAFNGSGINDLTVRGCTFTNIGNHWKTTGTGGYQPPALTNGSGDNVAWGFRMEVADCVFSDCGGDCVNLGAIQDVRVVNNMFTQVLTPYSTISSTAWFAAVFPLFCTNVLITGNVMNGMTGNAIDAPAVWECIIGNNTIRNSGGCGIGLFDGAGYSAYGSPRGAQNVTITGNVIENSGRWSSSPFKEGITLFGSTGAAASNNRIANNVITDTQSTKTQIYGVKGSGTLAGIWVDPSNALTGNATGPKSGLPPAAVTGAKGGNAALASLITTLAGFGLITDSST